MLWNKWNRDKSELATDLQEFCDTVLLSGLTENLDLIPNGYRGLSNTILCLDKLKRNDVHVFSKSISALHAAEEHSLFDDLISIGGRLAWSIGYVWARRLRANERDIIFDLLAIQGTKSDEDGGGYDALYTGLFAGWCETIQAAELYMLLEWPDLCRLHNVELPPYAGFRCAFSELERQIDNPEERLNLYLTKFSPVTHLKLNQRFTSMEWEIVDSAVKDIAQIIRRHSITFDNRISDDYAWFVNVTDSIDIGLSKKLRDSLLTDQLFLGQLRRLWICSHNTNSWNNLYQNLEYTREAGYCSSAVAHLAKIVPKQERDIWSRILTMDEIRVAAMYAFVEWLPMDQTDSLVSYANVYDETYTDPQVCAFQAYLPRASKSEIDLLWYDWDRLPVWQAGLLDRFMFAPHELKPATIPSDSQAIEADRRLSDPLDPRGY